MDYVWYAQIETASCHRTCKVLTDNQRFLQCFWYQDLEGCEIISQCHASCQPKSERAALCTALFVSVSKPKRGQWGQDAGSLHRVPLMQDVQPFPKSNSHESFLYSSNAWFYHILSLLHSYHLKISEHHIAWWIAVLFVAEWVLVFLGSQSHQLLTFEAAKVGDFDAAVEILRATVASGAGIAQAAVSSARNADETECKCVEAAQEKEVKEVKKPGCIVQRNIIYCHTIRKVLSPCIRFSLAVRAG